MLRDVILYFPALCHFVKPGSIMAMEKINGTRLAVDGRVYVPWRSDR
ncbi:MAG TPA: hypothetical protein VFF53_07080 [Geobacteraceae bacterium]|nr:hypothetical protein [Geobacteraceae bacterium]